MKIQQKYAVEAYKSLQDLNRVKLSSGRLAKQIYDLTSKLKPAFDFQLQEEQKLFEAHPDFNPSFGGIMLTGKSEEEQAKIREEISEIEAGLKDLSELDFDLDGFEPFELNLDAETNLKISGEDIGNLSSLINFV